MRPVFTDSGTDVAVIPVEDEVEVELPIFDMNPQEYAKAEARIKIPRINN